MAVTFSADLGPIDEDGYRSVTILADGEQVEAQYLRYDIAGQWASQEVAIRQAMEDDPSDCEHGLSAALCSGPQHF